MADRTSAEIFSQIFLFIHKNVDDEWRKQMMARHFWDLSWNYDFSPTQMEIDEVLLDLGLAYRGVDPDWPEDGETVLYRDRTVD